MTSVEEDTRPTDVRCSRCERWLMPADESPHAIYIDTVYGFSDCPPNAIRRADPRFAETDVFHIPEYVIPDLTDRAVLTKWLDA